MIAYILIYNSSILIYTYDTPICSVTQEGFQYLTRRLASLEALLQSHQPIDDYSYPTFDGAATEGAGTEGGITHTRGGYMHRTTDTEDEEGEEGMSARNNYTTYNNRGRSVQINSNSKNKHKAINNKLKSKIPTLTTAARVNTKKDTTTSSTNNNSGWQSLFPTKLPSPASSLPSPVNKTLPALPLSSSRVQGRGGLGRLRSGDEFDDEGKGEGDAEEEEAVGDDEVEVGGGVIESGRVVDKKAQALSRLGAIRAFKRQQLQLKKQPQSTTGKGQNYDPSSAERDTQDIPVDVITREIRKARHAAVQSSLQKMTDALSAVGLPLPSTDHADKVEEGEDEDVGDPQRIPITPQETYKSMRLNNTASTNCLSPPAYNDDDADSPSENQQQLQLQVIEKLVYSLLDKGQLDFAINTLLSYIDTQSEEVQVPDCPIPGDVVVYDTLQRVLEEVAVSTGSDGRPFSLEVSGCCIYIYMWHMCMMCVGIFYIA